MSIAAPVTKDNVLTILATTRDDDVIKHCLVALGNIPATLARVEEAFAALLQPAGRLTFLAINWINQYETIQQMRDAGRDELVHYAGALHRDRHAWLVTREWLLARNASEGELLQRVADQV